MSTVVQAVFAGDRLGWALGVRGPAGSLWALAVAVELVRLVSDGLLGWVGSLWEELLLLLLLLLAMMDWTVWWRRGSGWSLYFDEGPWLVLVVLAGLWWRMTGLGGRLGSVMVSAADAWPRIWSCAARAWWWAALEAREICACWTCFAHEGVSGVGRVLGWGCWVMGWWRLARLFGLGGWPGAGEER